MSYDPRYGGGYGGGGPFARGDSDSWRRDGGVPAPGELGIKEPRSWKTWQLVSAVVVAGLLCMFIGNATAGGSSASGSSDNKAAYTVPPPAGSSSSSQPSTSTTSASSTSGTSTSGTSTSASAATTTSVPAGSTTSTTVSGPVTVLLGPYQSHGNWTSPQFTIGGGTWNIGWAFQCTPAPAAGPAFQVFVVQNGASPAGSAAVSETGGSGQSVTAQTTAGSQQLVVEAGANCEWAVKVTGVA